MAIINALESLEQQVQAEVNPKSQTFNADESRLEGNQLYVANESVTMPKLHSLMMNNNGVYLTILDEVEGLLKSLDSTSGPDTKDRRTWLSLHNGMPWSRSSISGRKVMHTTRLNYTGENKYELMK